METDDQSTGPIQIELSDLRLSEPDDGIIGRGPGRLRKRGPPGEPDEERTTSLLVVSMSGGVVPRLSVPRRGRNQE